MPTMKRNAATLTRADLFADAVEGLTIATAALFQARVMGDHRRIPTLERAQALARADLVTSAIDLSAPMLRVVETQGT